MRSDGEETGGETNNRLVVAEEEEKQHEKEPGLIENSLPLSLPPAPYRHRLNLMTFAHVLPLNGEFSLSRRAVQEGVQGGGAGGSASQDTRLIKSESPGRHSFKDICVFGPREVKGHMVQLGICRTRKKD